MYTVAGPPGTFSHPVHLYGCSFFVVKIGLPPIYSSTGFVECFSEDLECDYPPGIGRCDYVTNPESQTAYSCIAPQWAVGREYMYPSPTTSGMTPSPTSTGKIDPYPPHKDTIMIPAGGCAIVDVVANNPGIWFHVENHAVEGMAVTLNEAQPYQNPSPPEIRQCGNFEPSLQDFYNYLDFDPNRPSTTTGIVHAPFIYLRPYQ